MYGEGDCLQIDRNCEKKRKIYKRKNEKEWKIDVCLYFFQMWFREYRVKGIKCMNELKAKIDSEMVAWRRTEIAKKGNERWG